VADNLVPRLAEEVRRSCSVWPLLIVPDVAHAPPSMLICGLPSPVTLTATAFGPMPLIVTVFDKTCVLST
jgi:hypothetical protein